MVEIRLKLAVLELEEEKDHLVCLAIMAGMTLLCASFSMMSLLFWIVAPADRLLMLSIMAATLFGLHKDTVAGAVFLVVCNIRRPGGWYTGRAVRIPPGTPGKSSSACCHDEQVPPLESGRDTPILLILALL